MPRVISPSRDGLRRVDVQNYFNTAVRAFGNVKSPCLKSLSVKHALLMDHFVAAG
jgi:hypothetical protein